MNLKDIQTGVGRSEIEMVDGEASKRNSRQTDSEDDEEDGKRCVTVDVASRNQTNSRKHESCNVQRLNQPNRQHFCFREREQTRQRS